MDIAALKAAAEAATPGEWHWMIHDHSMASLGVGDDPGMGTPLVLSVSPCRSCADRAKAKGAEWEWDRCTTPSEANATYISLANPTAILSLIERVGALEAALRPFAEAITRYEAKWDEETGSQDREGDDEKVSYLGWLGDYFDLVTLGDFRKTRAALFPANTQADE